MALRVLLADESSTIKKVMQLALQDFGVEVKSVPIGLDVLQVARSFNPDIIFADVLLAKKNGYEVSAELKSDSALRKIPVVLMWSGFMELDEPKAQASRAERRLEKPFDADTLRSMVKELVPSLGTNLISNYLSFPEMPEMVDEPNGLQESPEQIEDETNELNLEEFGKTPDSIPSAAPQAQSLRANLEHTMVQKPGTGFRDLTPPADFPQIEEIEEPEEFQSIPLPKNQGLPVPPKPKTPQDDWARQDLSRYKIELPKDDPYPIDDADLTQSSIALSSGVEDITLDRLDELEDLTSIQKPTKSTPSTPKPGRSTSVPPVSKTFAPTPEMNVTPSINALDPMRAEELIRQEARAVLESIAWKLLPEIVERVVREELQKLLKDAERL